DRGFRNWLRNKVGQAPVLLSDVNREYNENVLRNRLENIGFFHAEVASDTTIENRKATVTYTAKPHIIYRINSVTFEVDSSELGIAIKATEPETILNPGSPYNLEIIYAYRKSLDRSIHNEGYNYPRYEH